MKYSIEYQQVYKDTHRPLNEGEIVGIHLESIGESAILPNVGDYVCVDNRADGGQRAQLKGVVKSRLFQYIRSPSDDLFCHVNIVVLMDENIDWRSLKNKI